jgi:hypothetical protein
MIKRELYDTLIMFSNLAAIVTVVVYCTALTCTNASIYHRHTHTSCYHYYFAANPVRSNRTYRVVFDFELRFAVLDFFFFWEAPLSS